MGAAPVVPTVPEELTEALQWIEEHPLLELTVPEAPQGSDKASKAGPRAEFMSFSMLFNAFQWFSARKLKPSACPVVPYAFQSALTDDNFGISFKRSIKMADSLSPQLVC